MRTITIACCLALAACATSPDQQVSSVETAVTATGNDGATYRLPPGTRLSFDSTSASGIPNYDVSLDGDGDVIFHAAPGQYDATLYNTTAEYAGSWPLERTLNGVTDTVSADLITTQPAVITVTAGATYHLTFAFFVNGGTITFGHGDVDVSVGVYTGYEAGASGSGSVSGTPTVAGPDPADLAALMPGPGATNLQVNVTGYTTGDWALAGGSIDSDGFVELVCAPFALDSFSAAGQTGLVDLIAEASAAGGSAPNYLFGSANLCVIDTGSGNQVRIRWTREGTAVTPHFASIFGTAPAAFHIQMIGSVASRIYNSDTGEFSPDALLGVQSLPMTLKLQIHDDTNLSTLWYSATVTGTETSLFSVR